MSEKCRTWFQIHLSTAIVLMFVAAGLVWANVVEGGFIPRSGMSIGVQMTSQVVGSSEEWIARGWPFISMKRWPVLEEPELFHRFSLHALCANIVIALLILGAVASVCEWFIRHREARKP